jgi:hypothetical protein
VTATTERCYLGPMTIAAGAHLLILGALAGATACKTDAARLPASPESSTERPVTADSALAKQGPAAAQSGAASVTLPDLVAAGWLDALRRHDLPALIARTSYPFELRDTETEGKCGPRRTAANAGSIPAVVDCLWTDPLLDRMLNAGADVPVETLDDGFIPPWAGQWRGELRSELRPFTAFFRRDDASFSFIVLVAQDGVRSVWKTGFDATTEVQLATRWLEALRRRDIAALERLTSYPFELRDTERDAHCGTRSAAGPSDLPTAIDCLLKDQLFTRALKERSVVKAAHAKDFVPGFFQGWRRKEHADLWPTMALFGSDAGDEFDLTLLVAKDGVRVVWKRGSFSPPD